MSRDLLSSSQLIKRLVWRLLRVLARDLWAGGGRLLAHVAGDVLWFLDARGRRTVADNLEPLVPDRDARRRATRACYRTCAEQLAFSLRLDRFRERDLGQLRIVDPWHALPLNGPAVLATMHADWDALLAVLGARGLVRDWAAIVLPSGDAWLDALVLRLRAAGGATTLGWTTAASDALRHLRRGGVVGVLADRDYGGGTVEMRIGRRVVRLPTGPVELARRSGSPLVPAACLRTRGGALLVIGRPLFPAALGSRAALELARFQVQVLSAAPARWVAFHRIWER